jgi:GNAT superfamily N-acetyltransferase
MKVQPLVPAMLGELTGVYNESVSGIPHCHSVDESDFQSEIAPALGGPTVHDQLHSEEVFVAVEAGRIVGFVHLAVVKPEKPEEQEQCHIRFLWHERGRRAAGEQLLRAADEYCRRHGLAQITAFLPDARYQFYHVSCACLSDRLDQIQALLALDGYLRIEGEVVLDWPNYEPTPPSPVEPELEIAFEQIPGRGRLPGLVARGGVDGKEVALCRNVGMGKFSRDEAAQDWCFTTWLGVNDEFQGRGLGRFILRRALQEMHAIGYRHASISTDWKNHRAFVFYSNFGYRMADWTYGFRKSGLSGVDSSPSGRT